MTIQSMPWHRPPFERIALLLQGGGALGSYQAGVYQALAEANLQPDWVAGISIGAINSALIAGNPPELCVNATMGYKHREIDDRTGDYRRDKASITRANAAPSTVRSTTTRSPQTSTISIAPAGAGSTGV